MILSQILSKILSSRVYGEHVEPTILKNPFPLFSAGFLVWILALLLTSCSSIRRVQTIPLETLLRDTLYINKEHYDSIYIDNSHLIDRGGDTIVIKDTKTEYRFRFLRDTIYKVQHDSIPYEVRVVETQVERHIPWYAKLLSWIGTLALILLLARLLLLLRGR